MEGIADKVTIASCADFVTLTCNLQFKAKIRAATMGGKFSTQFPVYNHIEVLVAMQPLCGVAAIAKPTHLLLDIETSTLFAGDPEGLHDGEDIKLHVGSVCRLNYFTGHTTKQKAVNARLVVKCFDPDAETVNKKGRKRKHASFANLGLNHYGVPLVGNPTLHSADLSTLMHAVKTVMGFDQAEAGHLIGELTEDCVAVRRLNEEARMRIES